MFTSSSTSSRLREILNTSPGNTPIGVHQTDPRWKILFPEMIEGLATFLAPEERAYPMVSDSVYYAHRCIFTADGGGFLLLQSNQITLLAVAPEFRGRGYSKILIDAAKTYVGNQRLWVHTINSDVASKVYAPCGFRKGLGRWMYYDSM